MQLTQSNRLRNLSITEFEIIKFMMHEAMDLRNLAAELYRNRLEFNRTAATRKPISAKEIYHLTKLSPAYKHLPTRVGQSVLGDMAGGIKAYFELLKLKMKGEYDSDVNPPQEKSGLFPISFHNNALKQQGDQIRITLGNHVLKTYSQRFLFIPIPKNLEDIEIKLIRIVPKNKNYFRINFIYETRLSVRQPDPNNIMGIDLGLNNFATVVTDTGSTIINGRGVKSMNQWYNKQTAHLKKIYDKQNIRSGKKKQHLARKRYDRIDDFQNKAVSKIIRICVEEDIGTIVIGDAPILVKPYLPEFKDKRITQNFNYIPYRRFLDKLRGKCKLNNIEFIEVEESFSSIICSECGFQDSKNRLYRGYLRCQKCNLGIHADVNAAINIARQVSPDFRSSGCMVQPVRIRLLQPSY